VSRSRQSATTSCRWDETLKVPSLGGCSCFALGRKQVNREKAQKSATFTVNPDSGRSPALRQDTQRSGRTCREAGGCVKRSTEQVPGARDPKAAPWAGPATQEASHGSRAGDPPSAV